MYLITVSAAKVKTIIKRVIKSRIPPLKIKNSLSGWTLVTFISSVGCGLEISRIWHP